MVICNRTSVGERTVGGSGVVAEDPWNERYDAYTTRYDEDGLIEWPEESRLGGRLSVSGRVVRISISRVELSLDPWKVEVSYGEYSVNNEDRPKSCFIERCWDDKEAW